MDNKKLIPFLVVLFALLITSMCMFRLNEGRQAIITVFGKPRPEALNDPGLKFKMPWWKVHMFDKRILRWDGDATNPLNTAEQTFIYVDTTARWRIVDPLRFYTSVKTVDMARLRLDDIIDSVVRAHVSKNALIEMVRDSNREPARGADNADDSKWSLISVGRNKIMTDIVNEATPYLADDMGIELIDVRIKRLNYVESVEQTIFDRMIAERKRIAQKYRSEGEGEQANIVGSMERKLKEIQSEAYRKAQEIEGLADAEATTIYAEAFNRDPEFYAFLETLESYRTTIKKNTQIITTTDSEYFKYLEKSK